MKQNKKSSSIVLTDQNTRSLHQHQKSAVNTKSQVNILTNNLSKNKKQKIKYQSPMSKTKSKDFMNIAEKSTQDTNKFSKTLQNNASLFKDQSKQKQTFDDEVKKQKCKLQKQLIPKSKINNYDKLKIKTSAFQQQIKEEKQLKDQLDQSDSIEYNDLSNSSIEMDVQTIWNSDINEHDPLRKNQGIKFKSPFTNKNKQNWFDKYSPQGGFGQRFALKNDNHNVNLNKHIDQTLETVALQINKKEQLIKQGKNSKVQLAFIKNEQEKIENQNKDIESNICKQQRKIISNEEQKTQLRKEIERYRQKVIDFQGIIDKQEQKKQKLEEQSIQMRQKYEYLKQEIQEDIDQLQKERYQINELQDKYSKVENESYNFQKKLSYANRLEKSRASVMKEKSKLLDSLISEKRLTIKYGKSANSSPIAKKIRSLVKANHQ